MTPTRSRLALGALCALVSMSARAAQVTLDFSSVNTDPTGYVAGSAIGSYLSGFGITTPSTPTVLDTTYYAPFVASPTKNVISSGTGRNPTTLTFQFAAPVADVQFIRAGTVGMLSPSGTVAGRWTATAYTAASAVVSAVSEEQQSFYGDRPPRAFKLAGGGIRRVTFLGYDDNFAGINVPMITLVSFSTDTTNRLASSVAALDFGTHSIGTTAPAMAVTITNTGTASANVTSVTTPSGYSLAHNCTTLSAGASCAATIAFTPSTVGVTAGTLEVKSSAGTLAVALSGSGERSLVAHYYRSVLRRAPDGGGKTFWEGEAARMRDAGANANEAWFALATAFYSSPEYDAFGRDATGFLTDLYSTFFSRPPDAGGLAYWSSQLAQGLPREVLLTTFMFSPEFATFTSALFGSAAARPEIDTVVDFYRGLLARLPDDGGFAYWSGRFRSAQCMGPSAVYAEVEAISSAFTRSAEYTGRNRTDSQYVSDLYNAFLRRGGDLDGVQYWIRRLVNGTTREQLRQEFLASPEFTARVAAILAQGCQPVRPAITTNAPGSLAPLGTWTAGTLGLDPSRPVTVTFSDDLGYEASGGLVRVTSDGIAVIPVPIYVNPRTRALGGGSVRVTLSQFGGRSKSVPAYISPLPSMASYGLPLGHISRALLTFQALSVARQLNQIQMYQISPGSPVDLGPTRARLEDLLRRTLKARAEVEQLIADGSAVFATGAFPNGLAAQFDRNSLEMMDRVAAVYLTRMFAETSATAAQAAPKATRTMSQIVEYVNSGVSTVLNGASAQQSAWEAQKNCTGSTTGPQCGTDTTAAVAGGLGMTSGMLTLGGAPLPAQLVARYSANLGAAGAAFSLISAYRNVIAAETLAESQGRPVVYPTLQVYDSLINAVSATVAVAAVVFGGPALVSLALSVGAASAVVALTSFVYDDMSKRISAFDDQVTLELATSRSITASMRGTIRGRTTPLKGVKLCNLGSQSLCLVRLADASGDFEMQVPIGVAQTNYSALPLTTFDPVNEASLGSQTVNLTGLNPTTPIQIPASGGNSCCGCSFDVYCTIFGAGGCWRCSQGTIVAGSCTVGGSMVVPGTCNCTAATYCVMN